MMECLGVNSSFFVRQPRYPKRIGPEALRPCLSAGLPFTNKNPKPEPFPVFNFQDFAIFVPEWVGRNSLFLKTAPGQDNPPEHPKNAPVFQQKRVRKL